MFNIIMAICVFGFGFVFGHYIKKIVNNLISNKTKSYDLFAVELITAFGYLHSYYFFGLTLKAFFVIIFLSLSVLIGTYNIKTMSLYVPHVLIFLIVVLLYSLLKINNISFFDSIFGGFFAFILIEILSRISLFIQKWRAFSYGCSILAIIIGAMYGIKNFIFIAILSLLIFSFSGIPMIIVKAFRDKNVRLGISYVLSLLLIPFAFYVNYSIKYGIIKNKITCLGVIILIITVLLWSLKNIFDSIKNKLDYNEFVVLPFGPAMIIAATIGIFYLDQIKIVIKTFLY